MSLTLPSYSPPRYEFRSDWPPTPPWPSGPYPEIGLVRQPFGVSVLGTSRTTACVYMLHFGLTLTPPVVPR